MQSASIKDIKDELKNLDNSELKELVLKLGRFKKENKEYLSYILFLSHDEVDFRNEMKFDIEEEFQQINTSGFYLMKKGIRKILKNTKQAIRFSKNKQTEVELLLFFCEKLVEVSPSIHSSLILTNMLEQQLKMAGKALDKIETDLRHDYQTEINRIIQQFNEGL